MRREVRRRDPDVVVAFLGTPALLAELAGIPRRKFGLVVSERTGRMHPPSLKERSYFHFHRLADVVVSNSHSLKDYISRHAPWLRSKLRVIHNCVDLNHFCPSPREASQQTKATNVILAVGRYAPEKNTLGVISAIEILARNHTLPPLELHWYGNNYFEGGQPTSSSQYYLSVVAELVKRHLVNRVFFHDQTHALAPIYQNCSAFCLPSFYESFSNALSEAAACGLPLLASDVGDNRVLVRPKDNGFLFDPHSVESIAAGLTSFLRLSQEERLQIGSAQPENCRADSRARTIHGELHIATEGSGSSLMKRRHISNSAFSL